MNKIIVVYNSTVQYVINECVLWEALVIDVWIVYIQYPMALHHFCGGLEQNIQDFC